MIKQARFTVRWRVPELIRALYNTVDVEYIQ